MNPPKPASDRSPAASRVAAPAAERPRFVTAASLFDGHDASINIMRRILQQEGAEVIHLGHNRSVEEIVAAAIQEDAHGIAVSSYQGGHVEFFTYMVEMLRERGAGHVRVFGGGGGVIVDDEIEALHRAGVTRIYSVEDGRRLGLVGMIRDMLARLDLQPLPCPDAVPDGVVRREPGALGRFISALEQAGTDDGDGANAGALGAIRDALRARMPAQAAPIVGITGTGGAGKSSVNDELLRRILDHFPERTVAVLSVDPTHRRTGGALLGDRIRMNAARGERVFMRSMATRRANLATSAAVSDALLALRAASFDLILLETAGIGQGDSEVVDLSDLSLYVMTPEYGAPSQLEKIDMLELADLVVINKADRRGASDALREVRRQLRRVRGLTSLAPEDMPVFSTIASRFGDAGVDRLFAALMRKVGEKSGQDWNPGEPPARTGVTLTVVPDARVRYLAEIAETCRSYRQRIAAQAELVARAQALGVALAELGEVPPPTSLAELPAGDGDASGRDPVVAELARRYGELVESVDPRLKRELGEFPALRESYAADVSKFTVRGKEVTIRNDYRTLSGTRVPKVSLPRGDSLGDLTRWLGVENVPGRFPYTAGVFPFKRAEEDPTRMFAGEGTAERTNRRFHYVSHGLPAVRLSTAFDSVTLYGDDPAERPDIWGKIGNSGVSVCTLDDAKRLYSGFDLVSPKSSVSMTINGPAPAILAMFLNTAIDQAVEKRLRESGRLEAALAKARAEAGGELPVYRGELPAGHDGGGIALLGTSGDRLLPAEEYAAIKARVLAQVRGTVQADILKEDQAQNTCIFSTDFALKLMGDVQQFFVENEVRNFYSVSISGYHMAEAGANPITQLAFTLANGFTFVEYYRARGLAVDDFAPNLSFFFSNGLDAEYAVLGRVARRIWAVAMRERYAANERSQMLKYHIQTSGRSLHAQEVDFNDIRTTLQALYAIFDNCQSLHTNAYDEAVTTPTEESVRRALAIQLIINRELGWSKNENPLQGSFFVEELTDLVEDAVLAEFERLSDRGGVLGAMEAMYQRGKIQDESLHYETLKHSGELPIVGVNTFLHPDRAAAVGGVRELIRSSDEEKASQVSELRRFHERNAERAPAALEKLRRVALEGGNVFAELMETVKCASLGQISRVLYDVGGQYRRSM
ncbi:MAG: cobalamin-dependent protein [Deltaproteobacteria bacterium]|nr:cobalamin-dependent protein [Deltaproteobacteria bacterium]